MFRKTTLGLFALLATATFAPADTYTVKAKPKHYERWIATVAVVQSEAEAQTAAEEYLRKFPNNDVQILVDRTPAPAAPGKVPVTDVTPKAPAKAAEQPPAPPAPPSRPVPAPAHESATAQAPGVGETGGMWLARFDGNLEGLKPVIFSCCYYLDFKTKQVYDWDNKAWLTGTWSANARDAKKWDFTHTPPGRTIVVTLHNIVPVTQGKPADAEK